MMLGEGDSDLSKLVREFNRWQEFTCHQRSENQNLTEQLEDLHKQLTAAKNTIASQKIDIKALQDSIDNLHAMLGKRCDLEDENNKLKERLTIIEENTKKLKTEHDSVVSGLHTAAEEQEEAHQAEVAGMLVREEERVACVEEEWKGRVREKQAEIEQVQKQVQQMDHDHQAALVKQRMEYEQKVLKLQRQNSKMQQASSQGSSNSTDIFRKKLVAQREEFKREKESLMKRIADLEGRVDTTSSQYRPQASVGRPAHGNAANRGRGRGTTRQDMATRQHNEPTTSAPYGVRGEVGEVTSNRQVVTRDGASEAEPGNKRRRFAFAQRR